MNPWIPGLTTVMGASGRRRFNHWIPAYAGMTGAGAEGDGSEGRRRSAYAGMTGAVLRRSRTRQKVRSRGLTARNEVMGVWIPTFAGMTGRTAGGVGSEGRRGARGSQ